MVVKLFHDCNEPEIKLRKNKTANLSHTEHQNIGLLIEFFFLIKPVFKSKTGSYKSVQKWNRFNKKPVLEPVYETGLPALVYFS